MGDGALHNRRHNMISSDDIIYNNGYKEYINKETWYFCQY